MAEDSNPFSFSWWTRTLMFPLGFIFLLSNLWSFWKAGAILYIVANNNCCCSQVKSSPTLQGFLKDPRVPSQFSHQWLEMAGDGLSSGGWTVLSTMPQFPVTLFQMICLKFKWQSFLFHNLLRQAAQERQSFRGRARTQSVVNAF